MSETIFNAAFFHISDEVRSRYSISDDDLLSMVSAEFYQGLNNPEITGPRSMLHSLEKEEGIVVFREVTPEEIATREAEERELRILGHIARVETELELEGCAE